MANAGDSLVLLKIVGVVGQVCTCRACTRLDVPAGDPMDMGLPEYKLRSDLLQLWLSPGGAACLMGDPGAIFRRSFSCSVTGDILGRMPSWARSKGGMVDVASLLCGVSWGLLLPSYQRCPADSTGIPTVEGRIQKPHPVPQIM